MSAANYCLKALTLPADDVAAYLWSHMPHAERVKACALAHIATTVLDWYELGTTERIALLLAMVDRISTVASRQRQARLQLETDDDARGMLADKAAQAIAHEFPGIPWPKVRLARATALQALIVGATFDEAVIAARDKVAGERSPA